MYVGQSHRYLESAPGRNLRCLKANAIVGSKPFAIRDKRKVTARCQSVHRLADTAIT